MNIIKRFLTRNRCYLAGRTIKPSGIMVHSTATPGATAQNFIKAWDTPDVSVCVHALVDDTGQYQTLPWNARGWHCGSGAKGSANNTHISFEICEPGTFKYGGGATMIGYDPAVNQAYFNTVWKNAVDLCVFLCREYGLTEENIICHSEGYALGIASNHADVMHWFPKHGQSMDTFRAAVKAALTSFTPYPEFLEALDKLKALGIISVPGYWKTHAGDLQYIDTLIIKAASKITANGGNTITTVKQGIAALVSAGVISSPDYWTANFAKVQYLDQLIIKLANACYN